MLKEMSKDFKTFLILGLDIQFRTSENKLFVDIVISGLFGHVISRNIPANVNLNSLHFSANTSFSISSGFSPISVLNKTLSELIKDSILAKIFGKGDFLNVGTINSILSFIFGLLNNRKKPNKTFNLVLAGFNVLKILGFELKYDSVELFHVVSEIVAMQTGVESSNDSNANLQVANQMFTQIQAKLGNYIEQGKQMIMFINDYLDIIKNIDFDRIAVSVSYSLPKANARVYLELPGFTAFLNETFLQ